MNRERLQCLERIYDRQHYFIDRHDSMAEKFINVLLAEVTCLAIIFSLCINQEVPLKCIHIVSLFLFVLLFTVSVVKLFLVVRPLSSKAKKERDLSMLKGNDKAWIEESIIYYRGIVSHIERAYKNEESSIETYLKKVEDNLERDYAQQIMILAQYSNYKRKVLESSIWLIAITLIVGVMSAFLLILV